MEKIMKILGAALCFTLIAGIAYAQTTPPGTPNGVPEINPSQIPALITLVGGGLFILRSKFRK